jgi:hypothetical protein
MGGLFGCILFYGNQPLVPAMIGILIMAIASALLWFAAWTRGIDPLGKLTIQQGMIIGIIFAVAYGIPDFLSGKFLVNLPIDTLLLGLIGAVSGGFGIWIMQRIVNKKSL